MLQYISDSTCLHLSVLIITRRTSNTAYEYHAHTMSYLCPIQLNFGILDIYNEYTDSTWDLCTAQLVTRDLTHTFTIGSLDYLDITQLQPRHNVHRLQLLEEQLASIR